MFAGAYAGRRVLVTGDTGFKGAWLACWLELLGAEVFGFALPPEGEPSLYRVADLPHRFTSVHGDIRDAGVLAARMREWEPEIVFHLAAQSLVRRSYRDPAGTYATNVLGTVHLLEAVRATPSVRVVVNVTSDKCYENREWVYSYREADPMGGYDPYSSSKGCAELVTTAYQRSFFASRPGQEPPVRLHSVRAGNVIGGGDWGEARLIPDCIRALAAGQPIPIRNPDSVRPWQFILEPLSGYLWLAALLWGQPEIAAGGWNFGPPPGRSPRVRDISDLVVQAWGGGSWQDLSLQHSGDPHEAGLLRLDSTKAATLLGWQPVYGVPESVRETVAWYRAFYQSGGFDGYEALVEQIHRYTARARDAGAPWTQEETARS